MKVCETCIYHDPKPIPCREWASGAWQNASVVEYACRRHHPSTHYKGETCPDHKEVKNMTLAPDYQAGYRDAQNGIPAKNPASREYIDGYTDAVEATEQEKFR